MGDFVFSTGFEERDRAQIVALVREYETAIGVSLSFQGIEAELAALPGDYAPPTGAMILARMQSGGELVGMVALRGVPNRAGFCEMKRMYVRPIAQGTGLGRKLALAVIDEARRLGYARMGLDTLPHLKAAQTLYRSLGFRDAGKTSGQPVTLLFECELGPQ